MKNGKIFMSVSSKSVLVKLCCSTQLVPLLTRILAYAKVSTRDNFFSTTRPLSSNNLGQ